MIDIYRQKEEVYNLLFSRPLQIYTFETQNSYATYMSLKSFGSYIDYKVATDGATRIEPEPFVNTSGVEEVLARMKNPT